MITPILLQDTDELKLAIENVKTAHTRFARYVKTFYSKVSEGDNTQVGEALRAFKFYPPPEPTSRYKRTFRLKRSWRIKPSIAPYSGVISADSDTPYADRVMGVNQNPFFASRGWMPSPIIANANHSFVENELKELWTDVTIGF